MSKPVKEMIARELAERYGAQTNAVWIELLGVDGITTNIFRRELHARHMSLEVVKTSLFRRACSDGALGPLAQAALGPVALVTGGESAIEIAKMLEEWTPKLQQKLRLRGALLEGEYLDERAVAGLANMASKADLQARVAACVLSPGGRLASAVLSPGGKVAGCLKALIEKLEKSEAPQAA